MPNRINVHWEIHSISSISIAGESIRYSKDASAHEECGYNGKYIVHRFDNEFESEDAAIEFLSNIKGDDKNLWGTGLLTQEPLEIKKIITVYLD